MVIPPYNSTLLRLEQRQQPFAATTQGNSELRIEFTGEEKPHSHSHTHAAMAIVHPSLAQNPSYTHRPEGSFKEAPFTSSSRRPCSRH